MNELDTIIDELISHTTDGQGMPGYGRWRKEAKRSLEQLIRKREQAAYKAGYDIGLGTGSAKSYGLAKLILSEKEQDEMQQ